MCLNLLLLMILYSVPQISENNHKQELTEYIDDYLRVYPERAEKAKTYISTILKECGNDIDPLLVAIMISSESAWRHGVIGYAKKEIGLMQVHGVAAKGYKLKDSKEQIRAGVTWLRKSIKWCNGNVRQGLNAYGTGQCKPIRKFVGWRVKAWKKAIKKYRRKNE